MRKTVVPMFLLLGIVVLFVVPSPWNVVAAGVCLVLFFGELGFWRHRMRRVPVQAGAETMIGQRVQVVEACAPRGKVMVAGEIWDARCDEGAPVGATVVVTGRDQLLLVVEAVR